MEAESQSPDAGWPLWLSSHRYHVAGSFFVLLMALYGWLVFESGKRALAPTEQVSLALVSLFVSAVVGILIGEVLVARKVNVASQLRRAHGIRQALRSLHAEIGDARQRMALREGFDARAMDELWEEVSTHIQTALRVPMAEADRVIEDWGELDPSARARIHAEELKKHAELEVLYKELQAARSVEESLAHVEAPAAESRSISAAVSSLEARIRDLEQSGPGDIPPVAGLARQLVTQGHYQKAVEAYDDIVRRHPTVHTNYIGRARARSLAGDLDGALADLDVAKDLFPDDPVIERVREQVRTGRTSDPTAASQASRQELAAGNQALALGRAADAKGHFAKAAEAGANHYFARLNLAMAACLADDILAMREVLGQLEAPPKSYAAINKAALTAIADVFAGGDFKKVILPLRQVRSEGAVYSYTMSPLRFLEEGLRLAAPDRLAKVVDVFAELRATA